MAINTSLEIATVPLWMIWWDPMTYISLLIPEHRDELSKVLGTLQNPWRILEESLKKQSMKQRLNPSFAKNFLWNLFFPTTQWALDAPSPRIQEEVSSAKRFCIRFCAKMGCSVFYSYHYNQTYRTYIKCSIYSIGKDMYIYINITSGTKISKTLYHY